MRLSQIWGFPPFQGDREFSALGGSMDAWNSFGKALLPFQFLSVGDPSPGCWWGLAPVPPHWFSVTNPDFSLFQWNLSTSQLPHFLSTGAGLADRAWAHPYVSAREGGNVSLLFPLFPPRCDCWALAASLPARSTSNTWNCCIFPVLTFPDPVSPCGCNSRAEGSHFERQELLRGALSTLLGLIRSSSSSSFHPGFAVSHCRTGIQLRKSSCAP